MDADVLAEIRDRFEYNPETGDLLYRKCVSNRKTIGSVAGFDQRKYRRVELRHGGRFYNLGVHTIAWYLQTGEWLVGGIDHINRDGFDNRWCNLRRASINQNNFNRKTRRGSSGYRGVVKRGDKWRAQISIGDKSIYIGTFDTVEEASAAYEAKAREVHGEFYSEG